MGTAVSGSVLLTCAHVCALPVARSVRACVLDAPFGVQSISVLVARQPLG